MRTTTISHIDDDGSTTFVKFDWEGDTRDFKTALIMALEDWTTNSPLGVAKLAELGSINANALDDFDFEEPTLKDALAKQNINELTVERSCDSFNEFAWDAEEALVGGDPEDEEDENEEDDE